MKSATGEAMRRPSDGAARPTAKKRFGQHFLEPVWAEKVVRAAAPAPADTIIEIGPGRGAITALLATAAREVLAFEIDRDLAAALAAGQTPGLTVIPGDFLDLDTSTLRRHIEALPAPPGTLRVVANLPYNVASPILFKLIEFSTSGIPLVDASLMLQREVAERLLAPPGTRDYGVLSVLVRHRAEVTPLLQVPAGAFRPPPKVLSSVVRLRFHPPAPPAADERVLASLVQAVFTRRRKTLANALQAHPPAVTCGITDTLVRAGIDGRRRPETLAIDEFVRLADVVAAAIRTPPAGGRGD